MRPRGSVLSAAFVTTSLLALAVWGGGAQASIRTTEVTAPAVVWTLGEPAKTISVPKPQNYATLTSDQKKLVVDHIVLQGSVTPASKPATIAAAAVSAATVRCAYGSEWFTSYSGLGVQLYTFKETIYWCYNGSIVTYYGGVQVSVSITSIAQAAWTYAGLASPVSQYLSYRSTYLHNWAEGQFKYAPPPKVWTLATEFPYVSLNLYGDGHISGSSGRY
jgi:hypothetical protein